MGKKKSLIYEEYFMNENAIKKLYNMYVHQSFWEKVLDVLILLAVIFTLMGVILDILVDIPNKVFLTINYASISILLVFILELIRDYSKSKTTRTFFKKHWVDIILVSFLSLYFIFSYLGFAKILASFKGYFTEAKHFRLFYRLFGKG